MQALKVARITCHAAFALHVLGDKISGLEKGEQMFRDDVLPTIEKQGGKLVGLSKLRTACWFRHVYRESGTTSLAKLGVWFQARGVEVYWNHYSHGGSSPSRELLLAVDRVMKHASDWFMDGPERLPLWPILDGDVKRAKLALTRLLGSFDLYSGNKTLSEKWKALFDLLLRERLGQVWQNHRDLEDLVKEPKNYLGTVLLESGAVLEPRFYVGIIALVGQCIKIRDKQAVEVTQDDKQARVIARYFMTAIKGNPLASAFGEEVGEYITHWYEEKSA